MEDFSLNLLCREKGHLLSSTLDSLREQAGSFEILLLDGKGSGKLEDLIQQYQGLNVRIEKALSCNLAQMMNLGLASSKGKYIQFLEPGDRYITQHGLSFLKELISQEPHLITAKGVAQETKSHWFLKSKILDLGGFDERLPARPLLDLLCRLEKRGERGVLCGRVLVDSSKEQPEFLWETFKVLYRHFGCLYALKWFFRGRLEWVSKVPALLKRAFWQDQ